MVSNLSDKGIDIVNPENKEQFGAGIGTFGSEKLGINDPNFGSTAADFAYGTMNERTGQLEGGFFSGMQNQMNEAKKMATPEGFFAGLINSDDPQMQMILDKLDEQFGLRDKLAGLQGMSWGDLMKDGFSMGSAAGSRSDERPDRSSGGRGSDGVRVVSNDRQSGSDFPGVGGETKQGRGSDFPGAGANAGMQMASVNAATSFGSNRGDIARETGFANGISNREVMLDQAAGVGDQLQGDMNVAMSHDDTYLGAPEGDINVGIGTPSQDRGQGFDISNMG